LPMTEIKGREEMERLIKEEPLVLFYISRPACGVCTALKPKVSALAADYEGLKVFYVDLDKDESVAGQFSLFTIPGILVYVQGKEWIREARYISIDQLQAKLDRIREMRGG